MEQYLSSIHEYNTAICVIVKLTMIQEIFNANTKHVEHIRANMPDESSFSIANEG